jgi:uncharacterized protein YndB with AHSA1/START domain
MAEAQLARFIDRFTIEYIRVYGHPIERVWRAITDPSEFKVWFIRGSIDLHQGGDYSFESGSFSGTVLAVEAPRFIRFSGSHPDAYFQYELSEAPGGTRMRFVQHFSPESTFAPVLDDLGGDLPGGPDTPWMPGFVGGWHGHFDGLGEWLDGDPPGTRLAPTEFSALAAAWAREGVKGGTLTPEGAERLTRSYRRKERWNELNVIYRAHIKSTLPAAETAR